MKVRALHRDVRHDGPPLAWTRLRGLELDAPRHAPCPAPDRFIGAFGRPPGRPPRRGLARVFGATRARPDRLRGSRDQPGRRLLQPEPARAHEYADAVRQGLLPVARGLEIQALGPWVDAGLVEVDPEWIPVTPAGRRYLRAISACFDRYQRESARRASVDPIL